MASLGSCETPGCTNNAKLQCPTCIKLGIQASCCTSVNEVICHGIPDTRPLKDGDLCNVDITVYHNGFHGDLNETFSLETLARNIRI
ncbi:hypothetical protein NQ318_019917 [Aromia moschata]|uniref:Peptidase M24 domain-containing protein n=1 Tax=Aromia moschata TaxID=1265417 RepID=A0AAV8XJA1_9CUCU|nr:hypothetical protein NQ318_019917 [Aromia moschata]